MLAGLALVTALALADPGAMSPTLTADLDGDGQPETVTAAASRGAVRLEIRNAAGKKAADAKAPAPDADVVLVTMTSAVAAGGESLLAVSASTDASECYSLWRYHAGALVRISIQDASGKALPDCVAAGTWSRRWEGEADGKSSVLVFERIETADGGSLRIKDVYLYDGTSLRASPKRSSREVGGVPIPSWYQARLYTRNALDRLYGRFGLAALRSEPELSLVTDRTRGVFAVRLRTSSGEIVAPVEAFSSNASTRVATLVARTGKKTFRAEVQLAGDGSVPFEVRLEGLGQELDQIYAPAGTWHGRAIKVFPSAADELASQYLSGAWSGPRGEKITIAIEGEPPYRVRLDKASFTVDLYDATAPSDLWLFPADASGRAWGLELRGPNVMEQVPLTCTEEGGARRCQADGAAQKLHRLGARVNVS